MAQAEIDAQTVAPLREATLELTQQGHRRIAVDLEQVDFIDSMGLGVLVSGLKRVRAQGGDLILICTRPNILKVLEISGLSTVFRIIATPASKSSES